MRRIISWSVALAAVCVMLVQSNALADVDCWDFGPGGHWSEKMVSGNPAPPGNYATHRGVAATVSVYPVSYFTPNGDRVNNIYIHKIGADGAYDPDYFIEFGIIDYLGGSHEWVFRAPVRSGLLHLDLGELADYH